MKTTLIAHANLLVESKGTVLMTDPVLFGYLWEELNIHCPSINLDIDKIPKVDILNISHRHQDHFDIRTLAFLAGKNTILKPDAVVLAPNDEILLEVMEELGFKEVRVVKDFEPMQIKGLTLTPTPSLNKQDYFPEHGLLIHDGEVTAWNQVDTIVSPDIINYMNNLHGQVDFAHNRYLPLLEGNFSFHQSLNLPFEEYNSFLHVVKAVNPKCTVPGSAGFRYRDEYAFLNQYSFPATQKQFLIDLADFCPEIRGESFYPGDVAEITPGGVVIKRGAADFVSVKEDDEHLVEFKPVSEVPPLRSLTKDTAQHDKEMAAVTEFIEKGLMDALPPGKVEDAWKKWKVAYQLEVFTQSGSEIWSIDFASADPEIVKGRIGKINLYEGIACSELFRLLDGDTNWDFVGIAAQYRYFHNVYRVAAGNFECFPQDKKFPAPLMEAFPAGREMDHEKFMKDVRKWKEV
ncbi:MAG: MBL fold metallo-hydrolase [Nitrospinales bacterium]